MTTNHDVQEQTAEHIRGTFLRRRDSCRGCDSRHVERFLSLGPTPLANAYPASKDEAGSEKWYPLDVYFCSECSLVQLLDVVDPRVLFSDYLYLSGTSQTITEHNASLAAELSDRLGLSDGDLVVEAGSNDGSLLRSFLGQHDGIRVLGVEPAENLADRARSRGVDTLARFFDPHVARDVLDTHGPARVVIGNNVLAHVDDTPGFLRGVSLLLSRDGVGIVEVPYVADLMDRLEYDTIYHEHLCYFSVRALSRLAEGAGLRIADVKRIPIHGGSLRLYLRKGEETGHGDRPREMIRREEAAGLHDLDTYERFATRVAENRRSLRRLLSDLRSSGHSVVGYGAAAKGTTLLNYCDLGPDLISYVVDLNELKVGRLMPGAHLPIRPVRALEQDRPDYVLLLAWNFAEEILRQQRAYLDAGGRFIHPIPEPEVIGA